MHVSFRVDASLEIGNGHVMRCLTLAESLRNRGAQCSFICRPHQGHLLKFIAQRGHQVFALPALDENSKSNLNGTAHAQWLGKDCSIDAEETREVLYACLGGVPVDWLVVDHYALDAAWEESLRSQARFIMVIDDLADRTHACDLLLDQNLGRKAEDYYRLLKHTTTTLIGPEYALLRPEFAALRPHSLVRRKKNQQLRHLLVTMGGVDKDNATCQVLNALKTCVLSTDLRITVVMGPYAPWLAQVQADATKLPWHTDVLVGVNNIAQLMCGSDLAIGAAGSTSWERCCLGLPTIQIVLSKNQELIARGLDEVGAALMLPLQGIESTLPQVISAIALPERLHAMAMVCSTITKGDGAERVSYYMSEKGLHEDNHFVQ